MKKVLTTIAVMLVALTLCISFAACKGDSQNGEIVDVDFGTVLKDYLVYPDAVNVDSIENGRDGAKESPVDVSAIYENESLGTADKIAKMVYGATINEIACDHFAYFTHKVGSTNLGSNQGTLVYQRLRRQSDEIKDDITIKLPVNHNFNSIAANFVTSADIRYIAEGLYSRMNNDSPITYNFKTGLLEVKDWKIQKRSNWNSPQEASGSRSYDEAKKADINWTANDIVSEEGAKIEVKEEGGKKYYELTFSIDVEVANNDKLTIEWLENDNGGSNMKYEYCRMTVQIWECGLAKRYDIEESWNGKIQMFSGAAQNKQITVFSYSEADMDYSQSKKIKDSLK